MGRYSVFRFSRDATHLSSSEPVPPGQGLGTLARCTGASPAVPVLWTNRASPSQCGRLSTVHNPKNLTTDLMGPRSQASLLLLINIYKKHPAF